MNKQDPNWLIVTDLDGTLLDDSYPAEEAARSIDRVRDTRAGVEVVLASSKTLPEMAQLARHSRIAPLLIFENGGGVAWPEGAFVRSGKYTSHGYEVVTFNREHADICRQLHTLRKAGFRFSGFTDMSDAEVSRATGLDLPSAALARQRLTSEPVIWQDSEQALSLFHSKLASLGLHAVNGGRFMHISSGGSKALALSYILGQFRYERGCRPKVLACGDAPNDLDLLNRADHALVFPLRGGGYLQPRLQTVSYADEPGPERWLAGVQRILEQVA